MREIDLDDHEDEDDVPRVNKVEKDLLEKLHNKSAMVRMQAVMSKAATPKVLLAALDLGDIDEAVKVAAVQHTRANAAVIAKALKNDSDKVKIAAIESTLVDSDMLDEAYEGASNTFKSAILKHKKASDKVLSKGLDESDVGLRIEAINNPNCSDKTIIKALKDANNNVAGSL